MNKKIAHLGCQGQLCVVLSSFYIKNFRSILELEVDLSYGEGKAPNGHEQQELLPFIEAGDKQRLVPCLAFFGANASGKTNILKALGELGSLVAGNSALSEAFQPNLLNRKFSDTTLAVKVMLGEDCLEYSLTYDANEIFEEKLNKNGGALYEIGRLKGAFSDKIVSTSYPQDRLADILKVECSDGGGRQTKPFLNRIGENYFGLNADLRNTYIFFLRSFAWTSPQTVPPLQLAVKVLSLEFEKDEGAALRAITDVVRRLDIDVASINIARKDPGSNEQAHGWMNWKDPVDGTTQALQITTQHKDVSGKLTVLDFMEHESAGTQRLASLVGFVLHALKTGGVLVVDELECSLHPLLMREIVLLFKMRRHNPKGAQLIFTTHNTDILDDSILRLSEIALVKKTVANGTLIRRLSDIKKEGEDIRNVTRFRKNYLAGFYSGVPHPAL